MIISGNLSRLNFSKIRLEIQVPDEIYANTEFLIKIKIINNKRFSPAFLIRATILGKEILFPIVRKNDSEINYIPFQFDQRGRYKIDKILLSSVFPFNFFVKECEIKENIEFIVFPQMIKFHSYFYPEQDKRLLGDRDTMKHGFDSEAIFIRDYVDGDPLKYIHWKATAKTGKLKTKELSASSYKPLILDFESFDIDDTEKKISFIAYIIHHAIKKRFPVGLRIKGEFYKEGISRHHKINMLKALALYEK